MRRYDVRATVAFAFRVLSVFTVVASVGCPVSRAGATGIPAERTPADPVDRPVPAGDHMQSLGAGTHLLPVPVWIIGSYGGEGKPNMMTASWVGICCSDPPCVTISLRKATYTYGNIMERKAFTVNIPSAEHAGAAAFFGSVSGRDVDKLAVTGLTAVPSGLVDAPYLGEFPLVAECRVIHTYEIGLHTMFIGEIMDVKADGAILGENGRPDATKMNPFLFAPGSGCFYLVGEYMGLIADLADTTRQ